MLWDNLLDGGMEYTFLLELEVNSW